MPFRGLCLIPVMWLGLIGGTEAQPSSLDQSVS